MSGDGWGDSDSGDSSFDSFDLQDADPFESATSYASADDISQLKTSREAARAQGGDLSVMLGINPGLASAVVGSTRGMPGGRKEEFLSYEKRGVWERMTFACGTSYLVGIGLGGTRGFFKGLANSPSPRFRIRVNSVLNGCGRGARLGNALGVLAFFYTGFEAGFDTVEIDKHLHLSGSDWLSPVLAASATGLLYRSGAGAGVAVASGLVGMVGAGTVLFGLPALRNAFPQVDAMLPSLG